ncbi:MAG: hypothetical protein AAFP13_13050 [Pseudomonadota bacterium]
MTAQGQVAEPETRPFAALQLETVSLPGRSLGLQSGDILVRIDGVCFDGRISTLKARQAAVGSSACLLGFWRDGTSWQVASDTVFLGRWRRVALPDGIGEAPLEVTGKRNWDIWVEPGGAYDALPSRGDVLAWLVPFNLVRLRLWSALALWLSLLVVSVMLGFWLGLAVQVVVWIYFWRVTPVLVRQDWMARGFRLWRVIAAPSENALHAEVSKSFPQMRFIHGRAPR